MPKRSSKDANEVAFSVVRKVTGEMEEEPPPAKNPAAVALGRLGGLKGGAARAAALSKTRRKAIAKKAALTRWSKAEK